MDPEFLTLLRDAMMRIANLALALNEYMEKLPYSQDSAQLAAAAAAAEVVCEQIVQELTTRLDANAPSDNEDD